MKKVKVGKKKNANIPIDCDYEFEIPESVIKEVEKQTRRSKKKSEVMK